MGWSGANPIFDAVARETAQFTHLGRPARTHILATLIEALQAQDWDTEEESLRAFEDDEAVVDAFRQREVIIACDDESPHHTYCTRERLPQGHKDEKHQDFMGDTWPVKAEAEEEHDAPCDAEAFGQVPSFIDGHCTCVICARCGHHTGNGHYGHYATGCKALMKRLREKNPGRQMDPATWMAAVQREPHFCCPDEEHGCELEAHAR